MRADLSTMENIDRYLQGQMSGSELQQFESALQHDAALSRMVADQKLFIETVNRRALLAEINLVAGGGGGAWYTKPYFTIGGALVGAGILTAVLYSTLSDNSNENNLAENQNSQQTTPLTPEEAELISQDEAYFYSDSMASLEADDIHAPEDKPQHNTADDATILVTENEDNFSSSNTTETRLENAETKFENEHDDKQSEEEFFSPAKNKHASFIEGDEAMQEFIQENMRFPGTAKEKKISGNVKVKFLVTEGGDCTNIEANCFNLTDENDKPLNTTQVLFNQKVANLFEREAARIVRIMPAWIPATDSFGNPVTEAVELYFKFSLKEGNLVYKVD